MPRPNLLLAAMSGLDPRTVQKAIDHGIEAIKGRERRERLSACAEQVGLALGRSGPAAGPSETPPPSGVAA